jgi:hypothetical protein
VLNDGPGPDRGHAISLPRYEPRDVRVRLLIWIAGGFALAIGLVLFVITIAFPIANHQQYRGPLRPLPPTPRLQLAPAQDLQRYRASKKNERDRIEAAMRVTAAEGWRKQQ